MTRHTQDVVECQIIVTITLVVSLSVTTPLAQQVSSKNHLCGPCRTHYIDKHYDLLYAGGEFPFGPQAALTPRTLVAIYSDSLKTLVVKVMQGSFLCPIDRGPRKKGVKLLASRRDPRK